MSDKKTVRKTALIADYIAGYRVRVLAVRYGISKARIYQIIRQTKTPPISGVIY